MPGARIWEGGDTAVSLIIWLIGVRGITWLHASLRLSLTAISVLRQLTELLGGGTTSTFYLRHVSWREEKKGLRQRLRFREEPGYSGCVELVFRKNEGNKMQGSRQCRFRWPNVAHKHPRHLTHVVREQVVVIV